MPSGHLEGSFRLSQWVVVQRTTYNGGKLVADRVSRLEGVPGWTWGAKADRWERMFALLATFVASEGHGQVPATYVVEDERLGQWVQVQRQFRRRGLLTEDRAARLQALPGWTWRGSRGERTGFSQPASRLRHPGDTVSVPRDP